LELENKKQIAKLVKKLEGLNEKEKRDTNNYSLNNNKSNNKEKPNIKMPKNKVGILVEPILDYYGSRYSQTFNYNSNVYDNGGTGSGAGIGLRLGVFIQQVYFGIEGHRSWIKCDPKTFAAKNFKVKISSYGLLAGVSPKKIPFSFWGGLYYIGLRDYTTGSMFFGGSLKIGAGYNATNFIRLNIELDFSSYNKVNLSNGTKIELPYSGNYYTITRLSYAGFFFSISFPFRIGI